MTTPPRMRTTVIAAIAFIIIGTAITVALLATRTAAPVSPPSTGALVSSAWSGAQGMARQAAAAVASCPAHQ